MKCNKGHQTGHPQKHMDEVYDLITLMQYGRTIYYQMPYINKGVVHSKYIYCKKIIEKILHTINKTNAWVFVPKQFPLSHQAQEVRMSTMRIMNSSTNLTI